MWRSYLDKVLLNITDHWSQFIITELKTYQYPNFNSSSITEIENVLYLSELRKDINDWQSNNFSSTNFGVQYINYTFTYICQNYGKLLLSSKNMSDSVLKLIYNVDILSSIVDRLIGKYKSVGLL